MRALSRSPTLSRCTLNGDAVPQVLSAGGLQASRLAALDRRSFVFSSGRSVFRATLSSPRKRLRPPEEEPPEVAAADYVIPSTTYAVDVRTDVQHSAHRAEVMSVAAQGERFASVDAEGTCILSVGVSENGGSSYVLHPPSLRSGEEGWSGVALHESDPAVAVTARQFFRDVSIYDRDICVRSIHTLASPGAIAHAGSTSAIAIGEGSALALYEARVGEASGCVARKMPSTGEVLTIDTGDDSATVAVAGKDRALHIFDMRTMTFRERWSACLKYECAGARLSFAHSGMAYVCSVDNELACGAWCSKAASLFPSAESLMLSGANTKSPRRYFGFRADSRAVGMDRVLDDEGEQVALISENCALYVLEA